MRTLFLLLVLAVFTLPAASDQGGRLGNLLSRKLAGMTETETIPVIIYLKDKGVRGRLDLWSAGVLLSERSIARRAKVRPGGRVIDEQDLPVDASYVETIAKMSTRVRHVLKWFNAVSAEATRGQIGELARLNFVRKIDLVGRWRLRNEPVQPDLKTGGRPDRPAGTDSLDYGSSITQIDQINVPPVHNLGIHGEGVVVGVFDNGFRLLSHEVFDSMNIIAQYDFVDYKESVKPNNSSTFFGSHGVNTLSTIGGYKPGSLIGPAFGADFILARTENDSSETPLEEDKWAAAIEWADSIGVDVTSTSLGYLDYDPGWPSWTWEDMDGNTTLITRAADHAVSLGIAVVNSAGNEGGGNGTDNTLLAPADGDRVIAAGAVTSAGSRASFSSVGPTTDFPPRIKPDVMAMGVGVRVASSTNPTGYGYADGTSFSCPLSAGVAALIISANPSLGPIAVREAMRNTADNADTPNNLYGWGILNADSAVKYWGILPLGRISGTVYHDLDGNGHFDGSDTALAAQTVTISGAVSDSATSNGSGSFTFFPLPIGSFTLSAAPEPGWIMTTPPESLNFALLHREKVTGVSIGVFQTGTIHGVIFQDIDSNGVRDSGDSGLAGRKVLLTGPHTDSATTDGSGAYTISGIPGGEYTILQDPASGWIQSYPPANGDYDITVSSGYDSGAYDFGNFYSVESAFSVMSGWNLLSLPVIIDTPLADFIYPSALSPVYIYDTAYTGVDTITNGRGYWVKFPGPQNIFLPGVQRTIDTLDLAAGWNLIGTLSEPVPLASIVQTPDTLIASKFYWFSGTAYTPLAADSSLLPHRGYWVKCRVPGQLILTGSPPEN